MVRRGPRRAGKFALSSAAGGKAPHEERAVVSGTAIGGGLSRRGNQDALKSRIKVFAEIRVRYGYQRIGDKGDQIKIQKLQLRGDLVSARIPD